MPASPFLLPASLLPASGECVGLLSAQRLSRRGLLARIAALPEAHALVVRPEDRLFATLDVAGNVDFALSVQGFVPAERRRRRAALLALTGLEAIGHLDVRRLDPEQRAAVRLVRAAASGHRTLLLDDPFAGLDEAPRARSQALLRRLVTAGRAAVVVAAAGRADLLAVADRIGVEEDGGVRRLATVGTLFSDPACAAEASAIADANILTGRIEEIDPDDDREAVVRLACGGAMPARRHADLPLEALCLLAVRPDHIAFAAIEASALGAAALPVTLVEHRHLGDQLRLRLRLADGTMLAVRRPAGTIGPRDLARARQPNGASVAGRASQATAFPHPEA